MTQQEILDRDKLQSEAIEVAIRDALSKHPDCSHAEWSPGMTPFFTLTIVVGLWRNKECWMASDPPKYVEEGYLWPSKHN